MFYFKYSLIILIYGLVLLLELHGLIQTVRFTEKENTRQLHVGWDRRMNLKSTLKLSRFVYKDKDPAYIHQWLVLGF